jgi:xanthine dehydrogenase accessory factor
VNDWLRTLHDQLQAGGAPIVRVVVANVRGSAPREAGACMLVAPHGEIGTIGGGHLEYVATRTARELLESPDASPRVDRFSLGASLGQCCGGIVELCFQRYAPGDIPFLAEALALREAGLAWAIASPASPGQAPTRVLSHAQALGEGAAAIDGDEQAAVLLERPQGALLYERIVPRVMRLWLFGAGHVAKHLVQVISPLPFAIEWVDSRENPWPRDLPANVRVVESMDPAGEVGDMRDGDWALVMTHSHDEDFAICQALLEQGRFGWAGVIGSLPKATRFRQRLAQRGFSAVQIERLVMPIGVGGIRGKEPASIAIAVAAQLLQLRDARVAAPMRSARQS